MYSTNILRYMLNDYLKLYTDRSFSGKFRNTTVSKTGFFVVDVRICRMHEFCDPNKTE